MTSSTLRGVACAVLVIVATGAKAQKTQNARFRHLSVETGLSHEVVTTILQDSEGLLWFGTQDD